MKRFAKMAAIGFGTALLMGVPVCAAEGNTVAEQMVFEGEGYASPEECVTAYLEAMKNQDFQGMMSTFAIETYVENYETEIFLKDMGSFSPGMQMPLKKDDPYSKELFTAMRYADVVKSLYYQFLDQSLSDRDGYEPGMIIPLEDDAAVSEFLDEFASGGFVENFADFEYTFLNPEDLSEYYTSEMMQKTIGKIRERTGCGELRDLPIQIRTAQGDYLLCMQSGKYGDKWYNITTQGTLSSLLGIQVMSGGLVSSGFAD